MTNLRTALLITLLLVTALGSNGVRAAEPAVEVTDVTGRTVLVPRGAERVVLAEGRHLIAAGLLDREAPSRRLVALGNSLERFDPDLFEIYAEVDPHLREVAAIGDAHDNAFSPEAIADLNPDLIVMPVTALTTMQDSGTLAAFDSLGLPVLFIDFRQHPLANVVPSIRALGTAFDRAERAEAFIGYYESSLAALAARTKAQSERPSMLLHVARSLSEECCIAFGDGNMGEILERLGIRNPAAELSDRPFVKLNPEAILASDPDIVVSTVSRWEGPDGSRVAHLGYTASAPDPLAARAALLELRPGWKQLTAAHEGRVHLIQHILYDTPFQVFLAGLFAKWAWPTAFADDDPVAEFAAFHERFMPFPLSGTQSLDLPPLDAD